MMHAAKKNRHHGFLIHTSHLGDILISTNIIFNFARQEEFVAIVKYSKPEIGSQLHRIFDYGSDLVVGNYMGFLNHKLNFAEFIPGRTGETKYWCHTNFASMTIKPQKLGRFELPKCRLPAFESQQGYQVCQFDSASPKPFKKRFGTDEIDAAIRMFNRGKTFYIGREGTQTYTGGLPTHFASMEEQTAFIKGCDSFYGIDSGMSHFAGCLGKPGDICIQTEDEGFIACISAMYEFMYPQLRLHRRQEFRKKEDEK